MKPAIRVANEDVQHDGGCSATVVRSGGAGEQVPVTLSAVMQTMRQIIQANKILGESNYYIRENEIVPLVQQIKANGDPIRMSLNKVQSSRSGYLHQLEWRGIHLFCVTRQPLEIN